MATKKSVLPEVNEKGIAIAKEVLKLLNPKKKKRLKVGTGNYAKVRNLGNDDPTLPKQGDLQDHIKELEELNCEVCQLGLLLVATAKLYDKIPMKKFYGVSTLSNHPFTSATILARRIRNLLSKHIDRKSLDLLEFTFEGKNDYPWLDSRLTKEERQKAKELRDQFVWIDWNELYNGDREEKEEEQLLPLVRACMKNMIANHGYFRL